MSTCRVYDLLKETVIAKSGKEVTFEPPLIFEVGYSELQASQNYQGGFASDSRGSFVSGTTRICRTSRPLTVYGKRTGGRSIPPRLIRTEKASLVRSSGNQRTVRTTSRIPQGYCLSERPGQARCSEQGVRSLLPRGFAITHVPSGAPVVTRDAADDNDTGGSAGCR